MITQIPIACEWEELTESGDGEVNFGSPSFDKMYAIYGVSSEGDAVAVAEANLTKTINVNSVILFLRGYKVKPSSSDGMLWIVTATYKYQVGVIEMTGDTSGGERTVTIAINNQQTYWRCDGTGDPDDRSADGQGWPSSGGLVGVTADGKVDGCKTPLPDKFDFTILTRLKLSTMPSAYVNAMRRITGYTNQFPLTLNYRGQIFFFDAEELLFDGLPYKQDSDDDLEFSLKFKVSRGKAGGTRTLADYVQPAVSSSVNINLKTTAGLSIGQKIWIGSGGGVYQIGIVTDATHIKAFSLATAAEALPGQVIEAGSVVSFDADDQNPLVIGNSDPITKPGWWNLEVQPVSRVSGIIAGGRFVGGTRVPQPGCVIISRVCPITDLSIIGIFT